ncbi:MAG: 4Fe-4S dicluster domain-containing protein [Pyrobaculum sp.]
MVSVNFPKDKGYAVLVDLDKCIGCRACQVACKDWNGRPAEVLSFAGSLTSPPDLTANDWKVVFYYEGEVRKRVGRYSFSQVEVAPLPYNCLHCVEAPCARACPVGAIEVAESGAVVIVKDKCIGCGYCLNACPFDVPRRGSDGKYYKCTFCVDRIENGMAPACVEVCPTGVFKFGPVGEVAAQAKAEAEKGRKVYGLNADPYVGGQTRWMFVASERRAFAIDKKLPSKQTVDAMSVRESLAKVATIGAPILAAGLLVLGLASWRKARQEEKKE